MGGGDAKDGLPILRAVPWQYMRVEPLEACIT